MYKAGERQYEHEIILDKSFIRKAKGLDRRKEHLYEIWILHMNTV